MEPLTIVVLVLDIIGVLWLYLNSDKVRIRSIVVHCYRELLYNQYSVKLFLEGTNDTNKITKERIYDACKKKGIEQYLELDDNGKKNINNVLIENFK